MVNTRRRGRQYEKLCEKCLLEGGWLVHLVDMPHRWKLVQDLFSMFDILAIKKSNGVAKKMWIQVKHNDCYKKATLAKLSEFKALYLDESDIVQLWNYRPRSPKIKPGWEIITV